MKSKRPLSHDTLKCLAHAHKQPARKAPQSRGVSGSQRHVGQLQGWVFTRGYASRLPVGVVQRLFFRMALLYQERGYGQGGCGKIKQETVFFCKSQTPPPSALQHRRNHQDTYRKTHPGNKKEIEKVYKNKKAGTFLHSSVRNNSASPHENLQIVVTYSSLCCPAPLLVSYQPLFFPEAL